MDENFAEIIIDALTQSIEKKTAVTIKNNLNKSAIVVTATENEIIVSLSRLPYLVDEIVHIVSNTLGKGPDMLYNRMSIINEEFIIYYMVWLFSEDEGKVFVKNEFSTERNNITYMSNKALDYVKEMQ